MNQNQRFQVVGVAPEYSGWNNEHGNAAPAFNRAMPRSRTRSLGNRSDDGQSCNCGGGTPLSIVQMAGVGLRFLISSVYCEELFEDLRLPGYVLRNQWARNRGRGTCATSAVSVCRALLSHIQINYPMKFILGTKGMTQVYDQVVEHGRVPYSA